MHYKRRHDGGEGEAWERLLDGRVPPDRSVPEPVRIAARALRTVDPRMNGETARSYLMAQFRATGKVSDAWLKRV